MSADKKRDAVEKSIMRSLADHRRHGNDRQAYDEITAAMNGYLVTYAESFVGRLTPDELRGRAILAEAAAEQHWGGRT